MLYARVGDARRPVTPLHVLHLARVIGLRDCSLRATGWLRVAFAGQTVLAEVTLVRGVPVANHSLLEHSLLVIAEQIPVVVAQVRLTRID